MTLAEDNRLKMGVIFALTMTVTLQSVIWRQRTSPLAKRGFETPLIIRVIRHSCK